MAKILLVEDDKSLREIYGVRLLAEGYDIVSAGDGEEALAMAIKERPDLIVSDVMMPKISGFDMLDILRSTTETKGIKVIMMTALSSEDQRARGEALGADRYLVKSQVGIEDVVRTVHDVLGDSVAPAQPAAQPFAAPAPRPVVAAPAPAPFAAPAPQAPAPVAPQQPQAPAPQAPQPAPFSPPAPQSAQPAPPYVAQGAPSSPPPASSPELSVPNPVQPSAPVSSMPEPTAPFSTPRTGTLGDRVIHPLQQTTPQVDVGELINQELSTHTPADLFTPPTPPTPPVTPTQNQ
ncbi:MAG: hypothetical protein JWN33_571 [Candidatus Saccharibacteria bacterium]|nr:hypothetical protein [Candidatus Saccharibacteria bacterium]